MFEYIFTVSFIFSCVVAEDLKIESLITPCNTDDMPCLQRECNNFITQTAGGAPAPLNIKKFDPFEAPSIDMPFCCEDPPTGTAHMTNIVVTGLRHTNLTSLKMDKVKKTTTVKLFIDVTINSDANYETNDKSKSFSGTTEMKTKCLVTSVYPYKSRIDENGMERYDMGEETTICDVLETPVVTRSAELNQAIISDPDFQKTIKEHGDKILEERKKFACKVVQAGFLRIIQAFRQLTYAVGRPAYFIDDI